MRSEGYCSRPCVCVCVCVSVKSKLTSGASVVLKLLSSTQRATKVKIFVGISLKTLRCRDTPLLAIVAYCSDIPRTFSTAEPSKSPKKTNNRLNSTWNTTRCKVASFFLFSLRLLPKVFCILPVNVIRDLVHALSRIAQL